MVVHLFKQYLGYVLVNLATGFYMEIFIACPHFLQWKVFFLRNVPVETLS